MAKSPWADMFKLNIGNNAPDGQLSGFALHDPTTTAVTSTPGYGIMGDYAGQLTSPTMPTSPNSLTPGEMDAIEGGIGAAGKMTSVLAELAAQQAAMDQARKTAAAGTESNEKIAKMQLATDQENFSRRQRMAAYQAMIEASKRSIDTGSRSQASKGEALDVMSNVLARAMLRPKRRG